MFLRFTYTCKKELMTQNSPFSFKKHIVLQTLSKRYRFVINENEELSSVAET
jgi:hypothetical protein